MVDADLARQRYPPDRACARRAFGSVFWLACARRRRGRATSIVLVGLEPGRSLLDLVAIKQDLEDLLGYSVTWSLKGAVAYLAPSVSSQKPYLCRHERTV